MACLQNVKNRFALCSLFHCLPHYICIISLVIFSTKCTDHVRLPHYICMVSLVIFSTKCTDHVRLLCFLRSSDITEFLQLFDWVQLWKGGCLDCFEKTESLFFYQGSERPVHSLSVFQHIQMQ